MKNLSLLSIATLLLSSGCVLSITDDVATSNDDVDTTVGDGDGDSDTEAGTDSGTGDGDGDTTDATDDDVDTTADTTADTTDVDTTADTTDGETGGGVCGWNPDGAYYDCGFEGADPSNTFPLECPEGLVEGDPCGTTGLTGEGCCDGDGNNWYCAEGEVVFFNACG